MKAIVRYYDTHKTYRTKTVTVEQNEPNHIIREFIKATNQPKWVRITTVKCGRYEYQWFDTAQGAFGEEPVFFRRPNFY